MAAVLDDRVIVEGPGDCGERRSFHVTNQRDGLVRAHHFLTECGEDLWRPV